MMEHWIEEKAAAEQRQSGVDLMYSKQPKYDMMKSYYYDGGRGGTTRLFSKNKI